MSRTLVFHFLFPCYKYSSYRDTLFHRHFGRCWYNISAVQNPWILPPNPPHLHMLVKIYVPKDKWLSSTFTVSNHSEELMNHNVAINGPLDNLPQLHTHIILDYAQSLSWHFMVAVMTCTLPPSHSWTCQSYQLCFHLSDKTFKWKTTPSSFKQHWT